MLLPSIYIDTNIILDIIDERRESSLEFIALLERKNINCITSRFSLLEALAIKQEASHIKNKMKEKERLDDICKERHKKLLKPNELEDEYKTMYRLLNPHLNTIEFWYLTDSGWISAIDIMKRVNISAADAIHVATSEEAGCRYFVSNDSNLKKRVGGIITHILSSDDFMKHVGKRMD